MSEVLEAELAPSGSLKTGWIDLGRNDLFRDIWVVIFYLGLMLPYAFIGLWLGKVANKPPRSAKFELRLEDGSLLFARRFKLEKGSVEADDPTVGKVSIPLAELEELRAVKSK